MAAGVNLLGEKLSHRSSSRLKLHGTIHFRNPFLSLIRLQLGHGAAPALHFRGVNSQ